MQSGATGEDVCLTVTPFHLQHLAVFYERSLIRLPKAWGRKGHCSRAYVGAYVRNFHGPITVNMLSLSPFTRDLKQFPEASSGVNCLVPGRPSAYLEQESLVTNYFFMNTQIGTQGLEHRGVKCRMTEYIATLSCGWPVME